MRRPGIGATVTTTRKEKPMKAIILATDGSPSAERATATAIELAQATAAPLHIVTTWSIPISAYGYAPLVIVPEVQAAEREKAEQALAAAVEQAQAAGVEATSSVREGETVEEICAAARETGASLVVVGAHGWGVVRRLVFGSVSTGVLHHSPCPVLVVRAGDEADEIAADAGGRAAA
jgi:nucleotide-binding universal stress UspA family protein